MSIQFAFYHLHDDHVQLSVDGRVVFDRDVSVARDNARLGLAAVAQIDLPTCADVFIKTNSAKVAQRICLTPQTRSIVIDGGPPLTIVAKDRFQGED